MLKLMLVDDEPLIIKGLRKIVNWEKCGFEVVAEAYNGEEAVALAEKHIPHVIVTDVKMPGMDGLELVKTLNTTIPDIKFVILSGYDEFSYVQTAIKHGCLDYILKPVNCNEFEEILLKLRKRIDEETKKEKESEFMKEKLVLSIPALREKILNDIAAGNIKGEAEINENLNLIDIKLQKDFIAMTVELDNTGSVPGNIYAEEKKIVGQTAFGIINRILSDKGCGYVFNRHRDKFVVLITGTENGVNNKFAYEAACDIKKTINKVLDRTVTIGIGSHYREHDKISQSYKEAEVALKYKLFMGNDKIIRFDDIQHGEKISFSYPFNIERGLFHSVQMGDITEIEKLINLLFGNIDQYKLISPHYIYKVCLEMLLMTSRMINEMGGDMGEIFAADIFSMEEIMKNETIGALRQWFKDIYRQVVNYVNEFKRSNAKKIIYEVRRYINENYSSEIALSELAGRFFINPSYLSQLFKSETGQNLSDYITYVRLLNAKKLLLNKDLKIYEVSIMTGYPDAKYFSQVFKKFTGMLPKEYRGE